ncbi:MAG: hypothetical protein AAFY51_05140 [Pseudomonadota bacterium]
MAGGQRVGVWLTALSGLVALVSALYSPPAVAETVSSKAFFNAKNASCNLTASRGGWRLASTSYSGGSGYGLYRGAYAAFQLVRDPSTPADFQLADIWSYKRYYHRNSYNPYQKKNLKIPFFTGSWPREYLGNLATGRETLDQTLFSIDLDPDQLRFTMVVPNKAFIDEAEISINYDTALDIVTGKPIRKEDPALFLKFGSLQVLLKASKRPLGKARLVKMYGKTLQTEPVPIGATSYSVSVQTYTKPLSELRSFTNKGEPVTLELSDEARTLIRLINGAAEADGEMLIGAVEDGKVVYGHRLREMDFAGDLFLEGVDHYAANLSNDKCW